MSRLSLKKLVRRKLPYGKYSYMVLLNRNTHRIYFSETNAGQVEQMRDLLRTTCAGRFRLVHEQNSRNKRVYTHLYLQNSMDLAMLKLVHADKLHKIYQIILADTVE